MKYILIFFVLLTGFSVSAQSKLQRTPKGASYQIFTQNAGEKLKLNDVVTFQFIQKNYKDSVLFSTYIAGHPVQAQIVPSKGVADLMEIFPLLAVKDSVLIKVPADSIFAGHEDARPAFLPKGSDVTFILKIEKAQTLNEAIAERNAEIDKVKVAEKADAARYITAHKLIVKTTPSGLKYVITKPSAKPKPLKGDTLLVNYAGRTTDGKLFDSSIESVAKNGGLQQPGRTYEPLQVIVGSGSVIPGWDEGLLLLTEGSKATFIIPSSLAYGEQGMGDIKPYSTLIFDIELVKVKPIKHPATPKPAVKKSVNKTHTVVKKKTATTKN